MPLYKTITPNSQTTVKIWQINESYDYLFHKTELTKESLERVLGMKSKIHQLGFLSVRHLLATFGYSDSDLFYGDNGKPYLKDGKHISISHSFNFSAVIISTRDVGIDIEKQRNKITIIARKFIDYEFAYLNKNQLDYIKKLTVIWCIKESLYKLFAIPGLSFKMCFLVIPFEINDNETVAWVDYKNEKHRFHSHFFEFENFTCAYVMG